MKNIKIKIERYNPKYLQSILKFLKENVYTKRTKNTWNKNYMTSVIAKDNRRIIGILPFEKVYLKIHDKFERVLWISSLFLRPKFRNKKLGKSILEYSKRIFSKNFKFILVMREDEGSKAFRWYQKNEFKVISKILSIITPLSLMKKYIFSKDLVFFLEFSLFFARKTNLYFFRDALIIILQLSYTH